MNVRPARRALPVVSSALLGVGALVGLVVTGADCQLPATPDASPEDQGDGGAPDAAVPPTPGRVVVCLSTNADSRAPQPGQQQLVEVSGTVLGQGRTLPALSQVILPCAGAVHVLQISDLQGELWQLGYLVTQGDQLQDVTPTLATLEGREVSLRFRVTAGFGYAGGFVLRDRTGPVLAMEMGDWGPALTVTDAPGLSVRPGRVLSRVRASCGVRLDATLIFGADDSVELSPGQVGTLRWSGKPYQVRAVAMFGWDEVRCTDLAGQTEWALWR